jgi:hypothetical protein
MAMSFLINSMVGKLVLPEEHEENPILRALRVNKLLNGGIGRNRVVEAFFFRLGQIFGR